MIKKLIFPLTFLLTFLLFSQKVSAQKPEKTYTLQLSETPFETIKTLENDKPVILKKGHYKISGLSRMGDFSSKIEINSYGLIVKNFAAVRNGYGDQPKAEITVKNGILSSINIYENQNKTYQFLVEDSLTTERYYHDGAPRNEITTLFTLKFSGKKIRKSMSEQAYEINNELDSTRIFCHNNGALITWENTYTKEEIHFDKLGNITFHRFFKNEVQYDEEYDGEEKKLTYLLDNIVYKKSSNKGLVYKTITKKNLDDLRVEIKTYGPEMELIETLILEKPQVQVTPNF